MNYKIIENLFDNIWQLVNEHRIIAIIIWFAIMFFLIRKLAKEKNVKVLVFAEDVAASGGYLIACAGDEIYANSSSIIGSIGVIYSSFGLQELIKKAGIQRRIYTAGKNKSTLDPFVDEKKEDIERLKKIQLDLHADFI